MAKRFIAEIREGERFNDLFLVQQKGLLTGKTGQPYLTLTFVDRTGRADAKVWDNATHFDKLFEQGDYVRAQGQAIVYNGHLQLRLERLERVDAGLVNPGDFLPSTTRDVGEMLQEMRALVAGMENQHLQALVASFLSDEEFLKLFCSCPAAKEIHHSYVGGLLEHTLSIMNLSRLIAKHYNSAVNPDLLLAGAFFHDLGKVKELSWRQGFGYTDVGRLVGHITMSVEMLDERVARLVGFPTQLHLLLKHMILSHHGVYEFGSPKRPKTLEAVALSLLDDLDSRINSFQSIFASLAEGESWTAFQRIYDRYLYDWRRGEGATPDGEGRPRAPIHESHEEPRVAPGPTIAGEPDWSTPLRGKPGQFNEIRVQTRKKPKDKVEKLTEKFAGNPDLFASAIKDLGIVEGGAGETDQSGPRTIIKKHHEEGGGNGNGTGNGDGSVQES